jgi:tungstate transport system permease protein
MIHSLAEAARMIVSGAREVYFISWTSLRLAVFSTLIASILSIPLGALLGLKEFAGKRPLLVVLNTLMALPTVVVGLFVYSILSRSGPLGALGLLFTPPAVVVGQAILIIPLIVSLVYGGLSRLERTLPETLVTLGSSRSRILWMTILEARVAILSAVLAGFGRVIGEVGVAMMLGGNIRWYTRTLTTAIALETSKGEFELGLALGIILLAIAFLVNFLLHWAVRHER